MPRTRLFRSRADRAIGLARLILAAASIAALFLDPVLSRSGSNFIFGIGSAYLALARLRSLSDAGSVILVALTGRARPRTCLISVNKWGSKHGRSTQRVRRAARRMLHQADDR